MTAVPTLSGLDPEQPGTSPIKRRQIIDGATRVFVGHGFEGASMSQIAREAQVSKGTLYNYYESKSALFIAAIREISCMKLPAMYGKINEFDHDPERALTELARVIIDYQISDTTMAMYRIIVAEGASFPELGATFWENGPARSVARLSAWLQAKTDQGVLFVDNPSLAAEQFISLCQARIGARRRVSVPVNASPEAVDEIVHSAVAVFMRAYGRPHD